MDFHHSCRQNIKFRVGVLGGLLLNKFDYKSVDLFIVYLRWIFGIWKGWTKCSRQRIKKCRGRESRNGRDFPSSTLASRKMGDWSGSHQSRIIIPIRRRVQKKLLISRISPILTPKHCWRIQSEQGSPKINNRMKKCPKITPTYPGSPKQKIWSV